MSAFRTVTLRFLVSFSALFIAGFQVSPILAQTCGTGCAQCPNATYCSVCSPSTPTTGPTYDGTSNCAPCTGNCADCSVSGAGKCDLCTAGNGPAPGGSCGACAINCANCTKTGFFLCDPNSCNANYVFNASASGFADTNVYCIPVTLAPPTGTMAPVNTGSVAPVNTGSVAPVNTGSVAPVNTGSVAPVNTGSVAPVNTGSVAPVNTGSVAPVNTGSVAPVNSETMPAAVSTAANTAMASMGPVTESTPAASVAGSSSTTTSMMPGSSSAVTGITTASPGQSVTPIVLGSVLGGVGLILLLGLTWWLCATGRCCGTTALTVGPVFTRPAVVPRPIFRRTVVPVVRRVIEPVEIERPVYIKRYVSTPYAYGSSPYYSV